jgi:hypothetical protein
MPTAYAAPPLSKLIVQPPTDWPPVWPSPIGTERGYSLEPLYPSVVDACLNDYRLYELLSLTDALREGRPRESQLAMLELKGRFADFGNSKSNSIQTISEQLDEPPTTEQSES